MKISNYDDVLSRSKDVMVKSFGDQSDLISICILLA